MNTSRRSNPTRRASKYLDNHGLSKKTYKEDVDISLLEYSRYLQEVSDNLMKVPEMKQIAANFTEDDYNSDKLVEMLKLTPSSVRSLLDEAKRLEIERINNIVKGLRKSLRGKLATHKYSHVDTYDPDKFTETDLKRLLIKANSDLDKIDRLQERQFKHYEHKKKHDFREKLKSLSPKEQKETLTKEHKLHERSRSLKSKINNPGSQAQIKNTWVNQDKLDSESFDPNTFFLLHDINGDGHLDLMEVGSLFNAELRKMYNKNESNFDNIEMDEERHRMIKYFMNAYDKNKDNLVSKQEFIDNYKNAYKHDHEGWEPIDTSKEADYSHDSSESDEKKKHKQAKDNGLKT